MRSLQPLLLAAAPTLLVGALRVVPGHAQASSARFPNPEMSAPAATSAAPVAPAPVAPAPVAPAPPAPVSSSPPAPPLPPSPAGYPPPVILLPPPAPPPSTPPPVPAVSEDWSMGAGVGYAYSDVIGVAAASGLVHEIATPHVRGTVLLERRVWGHLYLLAEPEFGYVRYVLDPDEGQPVAPGAEPVVTTTFAAVAGVRWVANPGDVVELGMTHLLEARWEWLTANGTRSRPLSTGGSEIVDTHITGRLQGVGLSTGLVGERRLLPQLWVRVHLVFVRAAYAALSVHYQDVDGRRFTRGGESTGVSLTLDPRLELRLSW